MENLFSRVPMHHKGVIAVFIGWQVLAFMATVLDIWDLLEGGASLIAGL